MEFKKIYNNCYYLNTGNQILLISYESIIGTIKDNILYLSEYYLKYSRTTSKHINLLKKSLYFEKEIILNDSELENLIN